jgi:hypothetical protein
VSTAVSSRRSCSARRRSVMSWALTAYQAVTSSLPRTAETPCSSQRAVPVREDVLLLGLGRVGLPGEQPDQLGSWWPRTAPSGTPMRSIGSCPTRRA